MSRFLAAAGDVLAEVAWYALAVAVLAVLAGELADAVALLTPVR